MKWRREGVAAGAVLAGTAVAMTGNPWIEWSTGAIAGSLAFMLVRLELLRSGSRCIPVQCGWGAALVRADSCSCGG
jgi:hypothetical protein